jgi:hypothetical protein
MLLAAALGVLALLAIPAVGLAHHGHHHGKSDPPAGTVKSFDQETGVLVIDLTEGGEIEGLVTEDTRIRCEDEMHASDSRRHHRRHSKRAQASHDGQSGSFDNSGPSNSGDDSGDNQAGEPVEDNHDQAGQTGEDNAQQGEDNDNDEDENGNTCLEQLVAGATVDRAELELENGKAFFEKVSLMPQEG